jgi:glycosyltransferase involved in cell wall biosynthesis
VGAVSPFLILDTIKLCVLAKTKGFDFAIQALADVFGANGEFVYEIAGAGPEEKALRMLAADLGVSGQVRFCGWLEPEDLPAFYYGGILLHPARFEPYGVCILEAMASGLIVIASNQTGAAMDRIQHGSNGLLCEAEDVASLRAAIGLVVNMKQSERLKMGSSARDTAEQWPVVKMIDTISALAGTGQVPLGQHVTHSA